MPQARKHSKRIRKNREFLCYLCKKSGSGKKCASLIREASNEELKTLCEIALNLLKGNIDLNKRDYNKFGKKKNLLRYLADGNIAIRKKRTALIQKGKGFFLPLLAGTVAPIIASLFSKVSFLFLIRYLCSCELQYQKSNNF